MATEPPPRSPSHSTTRFRRDPLTGFAMAVLVAGFLAGSLTGTAATLAYVTPPTVAESCSETADYIGCIIEWTERNAAP